MKACAFGAGMFLSSLALPTLPRDPPFRAAGIIP